MNEQITKKCIVCGKEFIYNSGSQARSRRNSVGTRSKIAVTCSRKCSRVYNKIVLHIKYKIKENKK